MFESATAFNQDIGAWNVASVVTMSNTFKSASAFNADIGAWSTAFVTIMERTQKAQSSSSAAASRASCELSVRFSITSRPVQDSH
jgi:hypothetical protein